jgi:FkbH-like protein
VLDASRWLAVGGRSGSSAKGWYVGKVRFQGEVLAEAARDIRAAARAALGQARKLLVLDLDDTLWGGVVGDLGWPQLRLGGHDPEGEALVDFQRELKALTRRGVVLGLVSKNDEAVALEAIESHPEMVLRKADFVGWRINWQDKARNLAELAQELNLGLQSVVFIDDNPAERGRVREQLPEVLVPDWPADKLLYPQALRSLRAFDAVSLSREDAERTQLYAAERQRNELRRGAGDVEAWLQSLNIQVRAEPLTAVNQVRVAQLFNKTNQMNLSTRRLTEAELQSWAQGPGRALWAVYVADRFGDAGLTGIVSVEREGELARIVDFILSCRVFSRRVENAMAYLAVEWARKQGASQVEARYQRTAKNKPTLEFLQASGFDSADPGRFVWPASRPYALPGCIQLSWEGAR